MDEKNTDSGKIQGVRDKKGRFLQGVSGNPRGGPKGRKTAIYEIQKAIEKYQKNHGVGYWASVVPLAMALAQKGKTSLLEKLADKFLPSKYEAELATRPVVVMPEIRRADGTPLIFNLGGPNVGLPSPEEPKE